jgi:hypothetical protein
MGLKYILRKEVTQGNKPSTFVKSRKTKWSVSDAAIIKVLERTPKHESKD